MANSSDFRIDRLGESKIPSPMKDVPFVKDGTRVLYDSTLEQIESFQGRGETPPSFEMAGPRRKVYYDPSKLKCGIVTCGGICPGLNDVIRAVVLSLFHHYNVNVVFGFRYGYEGLSSSYQHKPLELTPERVSDIHKSGGTILGASRGHQDVSDMVDALERLNVGVLFAIGGDGTLRGAQAIAKEIEKRGERISVVGIPKTIDNDISYVQESFGFETAVSEARSAIYAAHVEAIGARNGIGLVKLMGRYSGFISANATLATGEVNFCLVPEVSFSLSSFLEALKKRLEAREHAVIVVSEGAGQDLMGRAEGKDASGNVLLKDIGIFLKEKITSYLEENCIDATLKYIDPSYIIRSMPANARDSVFCLLLGHNAVHAAMTGRTNMVVGFWRGTYTHVPIPLAVSKRKQIDPTGRLWGNVLESTGQPKEMK